jgi:hypothetical protein
MSEVSHNPLTSKNLIGVEENIIILLMIVYNRGMNRLIYTKVRSTVHLKLEGFSKRALQWYYKCYCVVSVTKTFTLIGVYFVRL